LLLRRPQSQRVRESIAVAIERDLADDPAGIRDVRLRYLAVAVEGIGQLENRLVGLGLLRYAPIGVVGVREVRDAPRVREREHTMGGIIGVLRDAAIRVGD